MAAAAFGASLLSMSAFASGSGTVIDQWATIKAPPPPSLKAVVIDPKVTALFVMDFNKLRCVPTVRARCAQAVPKVQRLLQEARAHKMIVVHTLSGKTTRSEMLPELSPAPGEQVIRPGLDKFSDQAMVDHLRAMGISRVILTGTSANGAVLFSAGGAAMRGFSVVAPIDAMPADSLYQEQFTVWNLAHGPVLREHVTLSRVSLIRFQPVKK